MSKSTKIVLGAVLVTAVAAATAVILSKELKKRRAFRNISDEGYETAYDVLYPSKEFKTKRLHYGPVLPA